MKLCPRFTNNYHILTSIRTVQHQTGVFRLRTFSSWSRMESREPEPPRKRRRISDEAEQDYTTNSRPKLIHNTLSRPVSPPPLREQKDSQTPKLKQSPFQLTWIRDLPESSNANAVSVRDILGDPLISECWEFNYLHDLDFLMEAFDQDVRDMVKVHVVHGFWKNEDQSRLALKTQASKYPNLTLHTAFMPEMFGTHHSKMLVLIRHDYTAQVIIHTANMIPFDWTNMTQGLWRSPVLPLIREDSATSQSNQAGSGAKFKTDFINYLKAYDTRRTVCKSLIEQLVKYDFSEIRASLVASVPGKQSLADEEETLWGWPGLKTALSSVPVRNTKPEIVVQISSIATLGQSDKWLRETLFKALSATKDASPTKPKFHVMFPTADEVRKSLNGYRSGSAIHTKIQSAAQLKQLQYLHPMLCHWAGDGASSGVDTSAPVSDAGRKRAAPHIKTFIRFADAEKSRIDWMLVTSANLSKQAWGEAANAAGEVRICSYEIGVLVWPELFGEKATMVPTFKSDSPPAGVENDGNLVVGARMPYDLPLVPYGKDEVPWCATSSYNEPDWAGGLWNVE